MSDTVKTSISIASDILGLVDLTAKELGMSRSGFVKYLVLQYTGMNESNKSVLYYEDDFIYELT